ncbi:MAG: isocitrate/isopropylmalate family dehydrogenase, partial [Candidatus Staskawiczbacteria bacterium]|nr:isocitrate/isopropylmalate family dehydrogenase [Candidatus Staskawiczbacteria bacterium]
MNVIKYFRYAFQRAKSLGLPLICLDKSNVVPHHVFWRKIAEKIHEKEFSDVEMRVLFSDDAVRTLLHPERLHGVIACTNVDGDYLSDGALEAVGSMGLMYSSAINPDNGMAMFESGAGTYPEAKGKDIANPIGRILTGALMLRHIGAVQGADAIERAVQETLKAGYRTPDLASGVSGEIRVGTKAMAMEIMSYL